MGVLNRLLLMVYSLLFLMLSAMGVGLFVSAEWGQQGLLAGWLDRIYRDTGVRWFVLAVSIMVLVYSLRMLRLSLENKKEEPGVDRLTEIGHIRISLKTLESLTVKRARGIKGIRTITARVRQDSDHTSVGVGLKLVVDGDTPIQTLSEELQQSIKTHLEEIAGVDVSQISVYIADTVQPDRSPIRVE
ncbi:MAG: alkaline shock response membrane anchor protein AmaP [Firmicutes bacterium]|nr:alkaline shock response membrane anchor protein AmaP [Bacillota bacterium]